MANKMASPEPSSSVTPGSGTGGQSETDIAVLSMVTAPFRANARPFTVAPAFSVIDVKASMFPAKSESDPSVAELPTCQNTLHTTRVPNREVTEELLAVVSVLPTWKTN